MSTGLRLPEIINLIYEYGITLINEKTQLELIKKNEISENIINKCFYYFSMRIKVFLLENDKIFKNTFDNISKYEWEDISGCGHLSDFFILKFRKKIDGSLLVNNQKLSSQILWEFRDELDDWDWEHISIFYHMDEKYLEKFEKYLNWYLISEVHVLTEEFVLKHYDKVYLNQLLINPSLSDDAKKRLKLRLIPKIF